MKQVLYSDDMILNGLIDRKSEVIRFLYRNYYDSIRNLVTRNSGRIEDAEDVFQDALVILYRKIVGKELQLSCSLKTYLYAICRNLWLQRLQKKDFKMEQLNENIDNRTETFILEESLHDESKYNLYQKNFLKLSKDCQRVLQLFLKKTRMEEITRIMGYSSIDYTKTRKYLCKKSLKEKILNDPEFKKYLM